MHSYKEPEVVVKCLDIINTVTIHTAGRMYRQTRHGTRPRLGLPAISNADEQMQALSASISVSRY